MDRRINLDIARVFAILCVVLTHVTEYVYSFDESLSLMPVKYRCIALILHLIGRLGVPIFFFLTGYLLLDRDYSSMGSVKSFWIRSFFPLVLTCEIWGIIYYSFNVVTGSTNFSLKRLFLELLFLRQYEGTQFWYIGQVLGIYLLLPFISNGLKVIGRTAARVLSLVGFLYLFIPPVINVYLNIRGKDSIGGYLNLSFMGGVYGFLVIVGWCIKKKYYRDLKIGTCLIIFVVCFSFTVLFANYAYENMLPIDIWYDFGPLVISSFCLFQLFLKIQSLPKILWVIVTHISRVSFGIYLIHNLYCKEIADSMHIESLYSKELLVFIVTIIISILLVELGKINKQIGKVIFYIK